jgi:hypothetical protein
MVGAHDNIRVIIPLIIRRRNGRPRILPPEDVLEQQARAQDPHILKALGRAWAWRRRLESGEVATAGELAKLEGVTERYVSRTMRLAYLSPEVLERMLVKREPPATTWYDLVKTASTPWSEQPAQVFGLAKVRLVRPPRRCGFPALSARRLPRTNCGQLSNRSEQR